MANRNAAFNSLSSGIQRVFDKMEEDRLRKEGREWAVSDASDNRDFQRELAGINAAASKDAARMSALGQILSSVQNGISSVNASLGTTNLPSQSQLDYLKDAGDFSRALMQYLYGDDFVEIPKKPSGDKDGSESENPAGVPRLDQTPISFGDFKTREALTDFIKTASIEDLVRLREEALANNSDMAGQFEIAIANRLKNDMPDVKSIDDKYGTNYSQILRNQGIKETSKEAKKRVEREAYNKRVSSAREGVIKNKKLPAEAYTNGVLNEFGKSIIKSGTIESGGDSYTLQWLFDNGFLK
ncbi:MAG: hypothetical protein MJZ26_11535 [Fibrobacter sp.]|nr:hypothetical protein [Fibrobacter sp.]